MRRLTLNKMTDLQMRGIGVEDGMREYLGTLLLAGVDILDLYGRMPILGRLQAGDKLEWGKGGKSRASEARNLIQTGMTVVTGGLKAGHM